MSRRIAFCSMILLLALTLARAQDSLNVRTLASLYSFWSGASDLAIIGNYAYVVDDGVGLRVLDVSQPDNPQQVGLTLLPYYWASMIAILDSTAYLATGGGIVILDLRNPIAPQMVGSFPVQTWSTDLRAEGGYLYHLSEDGLLQIFDLADPWVPVLCGSCSLGQDYFNALDIVDSLVFCAGSSLLTVVSVSDPPNPHILCSYQNPYYYMNGITVTGDYAYLGGDQLGILDISNPADPQPVGQCPVSTLVESIEVEGSYAFIGGGFMCFTYFPGLSVVDCSVPSAPVQIAYYPTSPFGGTISRIRYENERIYGAAGSDGLQVFDVSMPSQPEVVGSCIDSGYIADVTLSENYAYLADSKWGLRIVDVEDPANPVEIGLWDSLWSADHLACGGQQVLLTSDGQLWILNVWDPTHPFAEGHLNFASFDIQDAAVQGNYAYLVGYSGLKIIDISNPALPAEVGFAEISADGIAVDGDYAYASITSPYQMMIINISNPASPLIMSTINVHIDGLVAQGDYVYAAGFYPQSLVVFDVSDPANPGILSTLDIGAYANDVYFLWEYVYLIDLGGGIYIVDVRDPANPSLAGYYDTPGSARAVAAAHECAFVADANFFGIYDCSAAVAVSKPAPIALPAKFVLHPAHPNPFNASTVLTFDLPVAGRVKVEVFDINGRQTLSGSGPEGGLRSATPTMYPAGTHQIPYDGSGLPSGIYLARLSSGGWSAVQKLALIK